MECLSKLQNFKEPAYVAKGNLGQETIIVIPLPKVILTNINLYLDERV